MMKPYPLDKAYLVGFGLEAIIYGMYMLVFSLSMAFLLWRRKTPDINWSMVFVTVILFAGGSLHFWWNFERTISAFIEHRNEPGGPAKVVVAGPFQLPIDVTFSVNSFLGDSVLIYRCWLVWERNWYIVVIPILLLLISLASSCVGLYQISHLGTSGQLLTESVRKFGIASFIISLCLNFVVTALIAGRIWDHARRARKIFQDRSLTSGYTAIVAIIIESGAIFFVVQAIYVGLWSVHSLASTVVVHPAAQIYCLVPTMIIARVGLGISSEQTSRRARAAEGETSGSMQFATTPGAGESVVLRTLDTDPRTGTTTSYERSERLGRGMKGESEDIIKIEV